MAYLVAYAVIGLFVLGWDLFLRGDHYARSAKYQDRKIAIAALFLVVLLWPLVVYAGKNKPL